MLCDGVGERGRLPLPVVVVLFFLFSCGVGWDTGFRFVVKKGCIKGGAGCLEVGVSGVGEQGW